MTENDAFVLQNPRPVARARFSGLPIAVFLVCVCAGTVLSGDGGGVIRLNNPFVDGGSFLFTCAGICLWDVLETFLIGASAGQRSFPLVASLIGALRGAGLGMTISFCTKNAMPGAAIGMTVSFGAVSVLLLGYGMFMHTVASNTGWIYRVLCYLLVSGAVILLRLLPYVLL